MSIHEKSFKTELPIVALNDCASNHLKRIAGELSQHASGSRPDTVSARDLDCDKTVLIDQVERVRTLFEQGAHAVLVDGILAESVGDFKHRVWTFASLLGSPMVQKHLNHHIIEVYDRGGETVEGGARYHQTKQGAYIHNDGVSDPLPIDFLVLACGQKAQIGGESILIDASAIYLVLTEYPEILSVLEGNFLFENRGMSDEEVQFEAPIICLDSDGVPTIRYFRAYIEAAHEKAGKPLTSRQVEAMDFLDTLLDQTAVQTRIMLEPGQMLITADDRFLHTRTSFLDRSQPIKDIPDQANLQDLNRYMLRVWLRKN